MNFASEPFQLIFPFGPSPWESIFIKKSRQFYFVNCVGVGAKPCPNKDCLLKGCPSESESASRIIFISGGGSPFVCAGRGCFLIFRNRSVLIRTGAMKNSADPVFVHAPLRNYRNNTKCQRVNKDNLFRPLLLSSFLWWKRRGAASTFKNIYLSHTVAVALSPSKFN
jgi:hypothetical protein